MGDIIIDSDNLDDIQLVPTGQHKVTGELDLLDELQNMQDFTCYNIFKKKFKKSRKYREWKVDVLRDDDRSQIQFLEKQLMRMRKKEDIVVSRKMATKRNTQGANNQLSAGNTNPVDGDKNVSGGRPSTSNHNSSYVSSNGLGMNIRSRVKQQ